MTTTGKKRVLEQPIKVMDFALVVSDKKLKGSGLERGNTVMVMAVKDVAINKNDPYLKRTYMVVAKVEDHAVQIPNEKNDFKAIVVDPRSLQKIVGDEEKELKDAVSKRSG